MIELVILAFGVGGCAGLLLPRPFPAAGIACLAVAYFLLVGAGMAGDISESSGGVAFAALMFATLGALAVRGRRAPEDRL